MPKYLVTGGAGFIARHLVASLAADGHEVIALDNLSNAKAPDPAVLPKGVVFVQADLADFATAQKLTSESDGCFHLAACASVVRSEGAAWHQAHSDTLISGLALMRAAAAAQEQSGESYPIVYASSAATYGASSESAPLAEDAPQRPVGAYGADKLALELHARALGATREASTAGLRLFNAYGTGQDPYSPYSGVITLFRQNLADGLPLTLFGDGEQARDFVHVSDVVRAFRAALPAASPMAPVWNLCTGVATTIKHLAEQMIEICGTETEITYAPPRIGDARYAVGNPAAAARALGFTAEISLKQGLTEFLKN